MRQEPVGEKNQSRRFRPREAPPDTPSICGQASGLPSKACSTTPQASHPAADGDAQEHARQTRAKEYLRVRIRGKDISRSARDRSRRTGPSKAQPTMDSANRANSTPLTKIIFLRSRTFTTTSFTESAFSFREALRMHEASDFFQPFADARSGPEDFVRRVSIDAALLHGGNGLEIAPMFWRHRPRSDPMPASMMTCGALATTYSSGRLSQG